MRLFVFLSCLFVLFSFAPSFYEMMTAGRLPAERAFLLEHNYLFDYNFYLSRIRQGGEKGWLVFEKYYNQPHPGSFFHYLYFLAGKVGGFLGFSPEFTYHFLRGILGFSLLLLFSFVIRKIFLPKRALFVYFLTVTGGSWPILVKVGGFWRFGTFMGWWSAIDSLQRITFLPHVLLGQIFLLLFVWRYSQSFSLGKIFLWGFLGFFAGIVFPPTLFVVYSFFFFLSLFEFLFLLWEEKFSQLKAFLWQKIFPRFLFFLFSFPSLLYLKIMLAVSPWSALALFDIEHRPVLPYREYFLALGIVFPLGILGALVSLAKNQKKLFPFIAWLAAVFLLFFLFEKVPQQSPLRFTEAALHFPLGILAANFLFFLWEKAKEKGGKLAKIGKFLVGGIGAGSILLGLGVMLSMFFWLKDQAEAKRESTWLVPIGNQLAYPLKDFLAGIEFLRQKTSSESVVLSYVTAGNYIPAYAGNFVYLGHANTPGEEEKEKIAGRFFRGEMKISEAKEFFRRENISYVYFGPQEREIAQGKNLKKLYPFLVSLFENSKVTIYRVFP